MLRHRVGSFCRRKASTSGNPPRSAAGTSTSTSTGTSTAGRIAWSNDRIGARLVANRSEKIFGAINAATTSAKTEQGESANCKDAQSPKAAKQ
ncbi:MAG: hypothetical protein EBV33_09630 [Betaproteobacteria bacterium]|nr:hypothetical protein [Betaproteobacteria bacterium]